MKKLILAIVLFISVLSFAQPYRVYTLSYGLLTAYTTETQYLDLSGWAKIDSISMSALAKGGVGNLNEVDSIVVYKGAKTTNGVGFDATAYTQLCTLDPAASVTTFEQLLTSDASKLTGAVLRGVNMLKVVVYPSDETSVAPAFFDVNFQVWGTMEPRR